MSTSSDRQYVQYLSIGGEIALSLCLPVIVGYWLDIRFDTSPWILICGILVGIIMLIGVLVRLSHRLRDDK